MNKNTLRIVTKAAGLMAFALVIMLCLPQRAKAEPNLFFLKKPVYFNGIDPDDESGMATIYWETSNPPDKMVIYRGNPEDRIFSNFYNNPNNIIHTYTPDELEGQQAFSYDLKPTNSTYFIVAQRNHGEYLVSDKIYVFNYIRDVQVHSFGTPRANETFTVGRFSDMVPYGAKYRVTRLWWERYSAAGELEAETELKEGDTYTFLPVKKYAAKIILDNTTINDRFDYKEDFMMGIGEGKQLWEVTINGGALKPDIERTDISEYNGALYLYTQPVSTGEPAITLSPPPVTGVDRNVTCQYVKWNANFNPNKIQLYRNGVYIQDLPSCSTLIKASSFGAPHKVRLFYGSGENDYVETPEFKVCWNIDKINVNGFVGAENGKSAINKGALSVFAGDGYEVQTLTWIVKEKGKKAATKNPPFSFSRGNGYYARIYLKAKDKYTFKDYYAPGDIKINDATADYDDFYLLNNGGRIRIQTKYIYLKKSYSVVFNPDSLAGGQGNMDTVTVEEGTEYSLPVPGYTNTDATKHATKWNIDGQEYDIHDKIFVNKETYAKAVWEVKPLVNVTFKPGEHAHGETVVKQYPNNSVISLWSDEMKGLLLDDDCVFSQWNITTATSNFGIGQTNIDAGTNKFEINGDTTVVLNGAEGERKTLTFDANGGTGTIDPMKSPLDKEITLPECTFTPPENMEFVDWDIYAASDLETVLFWYEPGIKLPMNQDMVAKAVWKTKSCFVSFDLNGSEDTLPDEEVSMGSEYTLPYGEVLAPPAGKKFYKWEHPDKSVTIGGEKVVISEDTTFKALWIEEEKETCKILFSYADGADYEAHDQVLKGETYTFPECFYTAPEGMQFYRWKMENGGEKKPGDTITVTQDVFVDTIWVTAGKEYCSVAFDLNGKTGTAPDTQIVEKGTAAVKPTDPAAEGFTFTGWYKEAACSNAYDFASPVNADLTLYAGWKDPSSVDPGKTDPRKTPVHPDPIVKERLINGVNVQIRADITYPEAVTWTGKKITKEQLAVLSEDGVTVAKVDINGLFDAIPALKKNLIVSKLMKVGITVTGKQITGGTTKAFFKVTVKLNNTAVKKAKIKGANKTALKALVKDLNDQLNQETYYFEIVPIELSDESVVSVTVKAKMKNKHVQTDANGKLKGLKSVTVKVKVPAGKNGKTKTKKYTYKSTKAKNMFVITVTDASAKNKATADIAASDTNTTFNGTKTGITVKK